jgi:hypothetical protein
VTEANQGSLVSRGAAVALVAVSFVPTIEYWGGIEREYRSFARLFVMTIQRDPPRWLMILFFVPAVLGVLRLAGGMARSHVPMAAAATFVALVEGFFSFVQLAGSTALVHASVYLGLDGVVHPDGYRIHAVLTALCGAVWLIDELKGRAVFRPLDDVQRR